MKKALLFVIFFSGHHLSLPGQNLVLNPSFEDKLFCPYQINWDTGNIYQARFWHGPGKTPDYYNACNDSSNPIDAKADVPQNSLGYQYAHTGDGYAGIALTDTSPYPSAGVHLLYREYIEGTLQTPLQKDSIYRVEFFVSRAENQALCNRATDRIGVYFHQKFIVPKVYDNQTPFIINAKPQVENRYGRILYDTAGWTAVCGYFKAKGGEAYLTIGNFYDDLHTPYVQTAPTIDHRGIYYYIDDVSVEKVPQQNSPFLFTDNTVICALDSVSNYQVPAALTQVLWSTGDTIHTLDIPGAGQFWVQALLDDCLFTDTFQIKYIPPPQFAFPADSAEICSTALPLTLQTGDCCASLLWSTGDTTKSAKIFQPGWVWLQENNVCKTLRDSLYLSITEPPPLDLGRDTALCDTTQFIRTLVAPPGMDAYRWSTGDTLPSPSRVLIGWKLKMSAAPSQTPSW